jgi:hypothetical protein
MMKPNIIPMLTNNDTTVPDAKEVFLSCVSLPIKYWGFKDVGLPVREMIELVQIMRDHGKATCLEVVSLAKEECMRGAKLAVECGFDYLMGTIFYDSVFDYLKEHGKDFFPFCGAISGHPSVLSGTPEEIVEDGKRLEEKGVSGIDLLAYRHKTAGEEVARKLTEALSIPVVIAGSIDTFARMDRMKEINPWGFTIGTALFNKKFVADGSVFDNLNVVYQYLNK